MEYRVPLTQIPWSIALLALPAKILGTILRYWKTALKGVLAIIVLLIVWILIVEAAHWISDKPGPVKQAVEQYYDTH